MRSAGALLCLASAAAFGAMGIFGKLAYDEGATVGTLLATRFVLAAALLWGFAARARGVRRLRGLPRRDVRSRSRSGRSATAPRPGALRGARPYRRVSALAARVHLPCDRRRPSSRSGASGRAGARRSRSPRLGRSRARAGRRGGRARWTRSGRRSGSAARWSTARTSSSPRASPPASARSRSSTLVCTGAATTLTIAGARRGELQPGRVSPAGLRLAGPPRVVSTVGAVACSSPASGGSVRPRVDPVDPRAGRDRRARVHVFGECSAPRSSPAERSCCAVLASSGRVRRQGPHDRAAAGRSRSSRARPAAPGAASAVALGEAGATVYCTGRTTRARRSEYDRPETIEETAELVDAAGGDRDRGRGRPSRAARRSRRSWSASTPSRAASTCWSTTSGAASSCSSGTRRSGSTTSTAGLRLLRLAIDTHLITSHFALPLLIRRPGRPRGRDDRRHARVQRRATTASRRSTTWRRRR